MKIEELNYQERSLIEILRSFEFVKEYGYKAHYFSYYIKAFPSVHFKNNQLNQTIRIVGSDYGSTENNYIIIIEKRSIFSYKVFDISDYYNTFGSSMLKSKNYSLKSQVAFIQQYLMPVIKGEMWIDELIKKNFVL